MRRGGVQRRTTTSLPEVFSFLSAEADAALLVASVPEQRHEALAHEFALAYHAEVTDAPKKWIREELNREAHNIVEVVKLLGQAESLLQNSQLPTAADLVGRRYTGPDGRKRVLENLGALRKQVAREFGVDANLALTHERAFRLPLYYWPESRSAPGRKTKVSELVGSPTRPRTWRQEAIRRVMAAAGIGKPNAVRLVNVANGAALKALANRSRLPACVAVAVRAELRKRPIFSFTQSRPRRKR